MKKAVKIMYNGGTKKFKHKLFPDLGEAKYLELGKYYELEFLVQVTPTKSVLSLKDFPNILFNSAWFDFPTEKKVILCKFLKQPRSRTHVTLLPIVFEDNTYNISFSDELSIWIKTDMLTILSSNVYQIETKDCIYVGTLS